MRVMVHAKPRSKLRARASHALVKASKVLNITVVNFPTVNVSYIDNQFTSEIPIA